MSAGLVKKVVAVNIPETDVPGRIGYFAALLPVGILELQIAYVDDSRQAAQPPEKVQQVEVRPSACTSNGMS